MDVEYLQYIVDDNEEGVNAVGFDPEDAAAALFNCKLSDSFSNSSWSTNETVHSSFNSEHNSSMFEALDFSSFTEVSPVKTVSDSQTICCKRYCSPSPPLLSSTPILSAPFYSNMAISKTTISIPDPMATVRLDHFYTTRTASQNLSSPSKNFSPLLPQFLQTDDAESQVRRYSSRGRPAKSSMEKFIQLCVRGIPGVDRVHWEAELQNNCLKYICKLCSRQFGLAYSLKQHIRFVHMKVRPFPCESCDKKFRSMYDLRRHSTLHTRERFVCVGCGTAYCSKQRVIAHIRKQCLVGNNSNITKENEQDQYAIDRSLSPPTLPVDAPPLKPQIPDLWC